MYMVGLYKVFCGDLGLAKAFVAISILNLHIFRQINIHDSARLYRTILLTILFYMANLVVPKMLEVLVVQINVA
jgi:hypothetical protein